MRTNLQLEHLSDFMKFTLLQFLCSSPSLESFAQPQTKKKKVHYWHNGKVIGGKQQWFIGGGGEEANYNLDISLNLELSQYGPVGNLCVSAF